VTVTLPARVFIPFHKHEPRFARSSFPFHHLRGTHVHTRARAHRPLLYRHPPPHIHTPHEKERARTWPGTASSPMTFRSMTE
jgi:hypothetical protein